ncbi:MAG: T9SS type A sorting domain-containing protein [Chitinophagaceae bacterium]|nr:T9SS type A sorting domain-containing protein [Chitinophagaceae bacterium]
MGNFGSFVGDATPGSRTTVQRSLVSQPDRDWRFVGYVLPVEFLSLSGVLQTDQVLLNWSVIAAKEVDHFDVERSIDNSTYIATGQVWDPVTLHEPQYLSFADNIFDLSANIIYYRIRVIGKNGDTKYSNILIVRKQKEKTTLTVTPNPARENVSLIFEADRETAVFIRLVDFSGKTILQQEQRAAKGINTLRIAGLYKFANGMYTVQVYMNDKILSKKLYLIK